MKRVLALSLVLILFGCTTVRVEEPTPPGKVKPTNQCRGCPVETKAEWVGPFSGRIASSETPSIAASVTRPSSHQPAERALRSSGPV